MKPLVVSRPRALLLGVVCVVCLLLVAAASSVHASPLYLAKQRAGQMFTYEARRNLDDAYDAMLDDASYNYPYAFTEDMNNMIRDLFRYATLYPLAFSVGRSFDRCTVASDATAYVANVAKSGCYKTLLHAGVAGDCVAANPLCCVLYWRYPADLPDRLPASAIDPQLIFWDGSKAVNGFYTNFSLSYRATYSSCAALPTWPAGNTAADGVALSMDADGEWRFTRRRQPVLSFVEHLITSPTGAQASEYAALEAAGAPLWGKRGQFGGLTIIAPIVVCSVLLLASLVLLLITYCCTEPQARKEKEELQLQIEILETTTAEQESEICRRRTRSEPRSSQSTRGSVVQQQPKESPSPVDFRRSSSGFTPQPSQLHVSPQQRQLAGSMRMGVTPSPSPQRQQQQMQLYDAGHVFSPVSQPQSGRATPTTLSRHGSQSQMTMENAITPPLQRAMASGRRANITSDHRRPAKRDGQESPQPAVSGNGSFAGRASMRQSPRNGSFTGQQQARQLSRNGSFAASSTSPSPASRKFSQNFQNPLLGRQTFK